MHKSIIIVAGGSGRRLESPVPKQFLNLAGIPMLMRTISLFHHFDPALDIIVVLPGQQLETWRDLCLKYNFTVEHRQITGGETRFHSVSNGFSLVEKDSLTGVHDGVRPMVSFETIQRCYENAEVHGNAVPAVRLHESVREVTEKGSRIIDRENIRLIQTPQVFRYHQLDEAYHQPYRPSFTDDASVVESAGYEIKIVEGNQENIKVTTRFDLDLAEILVRNTGI